MRPASSISSCTWATIRVSIFGWVLQAGGSFADPSCVQFDVPVHVPCLAITREFEDGMLVIEARFPVSALVHYQREEQLSANLYRIDSPERSMVVTDYSPSTSLNPYVSGNVAIESNEKWDVIGTQF